MVESGGLEIRCAALRYRGFESHPLRSAVRARVSSAGMTGEVTEWPKVHAWKACVPLKGTEGSNPSLSVRLFSVDDRAPCGWLSPNPVRSGRKQRYVIRQGAADRLVRAEEAFFSQAVPWNMK